MAEESMTLLETPREGDGGEFDFPWEAVRCFVHELMDEEVASLIGAERYERKEGRTNQRDGVRHRTWDTGVGTIDLALPKLRTGSEASLRKLTETHAEAELELATT
ncbi:MAG: transposase [Chloroflexota bacterium]